MLIQLYSVLHMQRYKKISHRSHCFQNFRCFQIFTDFQDFPDNPILSYFQITKPVRNILLPRTSAYYKDVNYKDINLIKNL